MGGGSETNCKVPRSILCLLPAAAPAAGSRSMELAFSDRGGGRRGEQTHMHHLHHLQQQQLKADTMHYTRVKIRSWQLHEASEEKRHQRPPLAAFNHFILFFLINKTKERKKKKKHFESHESHVFIFFWMALRIHQQLTTLPSSSYFESGTVLPFVPLPTCFFNHPLLLKVLQISWLAESQTNKKIAIKKKLFPFRTQESF